MMQSDCQLQFDLMQSGCQTVFARKYLYINCSKKEFAHGKWQAKIDGMELLL
jgi:hypothetical protein